MPSETKNYKQRKYWIWGLLSLPAFYVFVRYMTDRISYGQVIHETGDWSVGLLVFTLAITPFRRLFPKAKLARWLVMHRRALGVASFAYAAFHTVTYLERKWGYGYILKEAQSSGLLTGWIALVIFLILAVTSNNGSVRFLKQNWQRLHRLVYIAAGLVFAHWILTALDPKIAYISLLILCLIEALRFLRPIKRAD